MYLYLVGILQTTLKRIVVVNISLSTATTDSSSI